MGIATYNSDQFTKEALTTMNEERKMYFANIGVDINNATNLENAIKIAGLDYEVVKKPLYYETTTEEGKAKAKLFPKMYATVRTDTNTPLGVVGEKYNILQNKEAFDFLDSLIVGGAKFETAGTFRRNEAASFITISTDTIKILDDEIKPYILLTNSFDGTGSVRCMFTPTRVWCSNTLVLAMTNAVNKISIRHSKSLDVKMKEARHLLLANTEYLERLNEIAEKLATTAFSEQAFEALAKELFPIKEEDSNAVKVHNLAKVEALLTAYRQPDLQNFNNTAWKAVQAASDFESHLPVARVTKSYDEKNIKVVMAGMPLLNMVFDRMQNLVAA